MHDYRIIERGKPLNEAAKAIILLHGRGATAGNIIGLAYEFCDDTFYIAAPQATNNTWYPQGFMVDREMNEPWLSAAIDVVKRLIDATTTHIPAGHIYLMGFSQGACLALEVAARFAQRYAGVASFTGGLIGKETDPELYSGDFEGTKIFIGNSDNDPHVPVRRSEESRDILESLGASVTLEIYPGMPHTIIPKEIERVKELMF